MSSPHSIFTAPKNRTNTPASSAGTYRAGNNLRRSSTPENVFKPEKAKSPSAGTDSQLRTAAQTSGSSLHPKASQNLGIWSWKSGYPSEQDRQLQRHNRSASISHVPNLESTKQTAFVPGTKRPLPAEFVKPISPFEDSLLKKARIFIRPRHTLDPSTFPRDPARDLQPPSPLFFSNNRRTRPFLPPRYSSSEAEATMMSNASMEEGSNIRTVKMARGVLEIGGSPSRAMSTPTGRLPVGTSSGSASRIHTPDGKDISNGLQALSYVGIEELLELDDRPTFIINLTEPSNYKPGPLQVAFANSSLRSYTGLLNMIVGNPSEESLGLAVTTTLLDFKAWTVSFVKNDESLDVCLPSFLFAGINWTCSTLRKRFRVFSGSPPQGSSSLSSNPTSVGAPAPSSFSDAFSSGYQNFNGSSTKSTQEEPTDYFGDVQIPTSPTQVSESIITTSETNNEIEEPQYQLPMSNKMLDPGPPLRASCSSEPLSPLGTRSNKAILRAASAANVDAFDTSAVPGQGFFDWTRLPITPALPRHIQFARSIDWESTSLGPIESWPSALRGMCNLIMASPHPAAMYWGDDLIAIYNEAYILLAGQKHPALMGQSYREAWSEIWDAVKDVFADAKLTGQATMKDDDCLFMKRSGYLEETYFSWCVE